MKRAALFAAVLTLIMAGAIAAQTSVGEISGYVYDEQGAVVPHVTITVTSPAMMGGRRLKSGEVGQYRVIKLPPGNYTLTISKENYQTQEIQNISVRAGRISSYNITLKVREFENTVTIVHEAPVIDVKNPQRGMNISGEYYARLPVHYNRQWDNVMALVPGTINTGQYSRTTPYVEVHNAQPFQNVFNLDGMRIGSMNENTNNVQFNTDIIEEVNVVTTGIDAGASAGYGGYVNVVTRSGGNDFHGSASFTFQPAAWNWNNIPDGLAAERALYIPGLSIGGPIVKDKTWFFTSYRRFHQNEALAYTASNIESFHAVDLEVPDQPTSDRSNQIFAKITQYISENHKAFATLNIDEGHTDNSDMYTSGSKDTGWIVDSGGKYGNVSLSSIWNDSLSSTLKLSYYNSDRDTVNVTGRDASTRYRYSDSVWTGTGNRTGTGSYAFYNGYFNGYSGSNRSDERLELKGDGNLYLEDLMGQHSVTFGFAYIPVQEYKSVNLYNSTGPQLIREIKNDAGEWVTFYEKEYTVDEFSSIDKGIKNYAVYAQDAWTINDRLTVTAGLRVENQDDGLIYNLTGLNPNIGASYALSREYNDAIRFSYGLRRYLFNAQDVFSAQVGGSAGYIERWDNDLDGTWDAFNERITTAKSDFDPDSYNFDPDLEPAWSHNWQVGYNRLMPWSTKLDVAYIYKEFRGRLTNINTNIIWDGDTFAGYVDPSTTYTSYKTNNKWNYTYTSSLETTITRDFREGWQLIASYTMMTNGEKGDWNPDQAQAHFHPEDWYDTSQTRHIVRIAGNFTLPYDFTLSTNVLWQTAPAEKPYTMPRGTGLEGIDRYYTLPNGKQVTHPFYNAVLYYRPRSVREVTMESLGIVNLGLGKNFTLYGYRFETQVQAFNLFNADSPTAYSSYHYIVDENGDYVYDRPKFGAIQAPRVVQAFVKWRF